ncbi:MAG: ATP-binding protein [Xenococcaceae cyanobacterium]
MKLSFFKSLQFRMPLLVLAGIIPVISVASFYATESASKKIIEEEKENLALKSQLLAENIQNWNQSNVLALLNLSKQPDVTSNIPNSRYKKILTEIVDTYEHLYLAHTMNLQGWNIARSDDKSLKYYGDRNYFKGAIEGNKVNYETIISRTTKQPALCMSTPTNNGGKIVGATSICTDLNDLTEQVGRLRFGQTGYALLVDEHGDLLAHPDAELLSGDTLTNLKEYKPVENVLLGNEGEFYFIDENEVKWIAHSTKLNNGWAVVILQEETEFLANKTQFQNLASSISFIVILGTSALTFLLANRLIKPIKNLSNAAINISEGQLDRRVDIKREDELGILASSFNHMATQLNKYFDELEKTFQKLEKAKEEAVSANHAKDRFLANISHEFRTPLNSVLGYAKILQRDSSLNEEQVDQISTIQQSGTYLLTLINDILDLSKSKTGKLELEPKEFDLTSSLKSIIRIVESEAKDKSLKLRAKFINLPSTIVADEKRLTQVLLNLLNNAIKFTSNGEIVLKVSRVDTVSNSNSLLQQKIRYEVIDTGKGIKQAELKKIFQPFEQVGDMPSRHIGTGLGLSISKQLVELMGGKLRVKSKVGEGSIFWFETLLAEETISNNRQPKLDMGLISGYKGKKRKLLVVDDKPENRLLLANLLKPIGFEVAMAEDGEQMLEMVQQERPDLVFLDLFMPVKTGFTSAKQLQRKSEFKDIPIIILSACSITPEMRKYLDCEAFLGKPFEEDELLALLQKHLGLEWTYREEEQKLPMSVSESHARQAMVL